MALAAGVAMGTGGCSGSDTGTAPAGDVGGTVGSTGGVTSAAGGQATGGLSNPASSNVGGAVASSGGNSSSSAGGAATGGVSTTKSTGACGSVATGGSKSTGGATGIGGSSAIAGSSATGGTKAATGGTTAGGVAATGGTKAATGGTTAGGVAATGGATQTGSCAAPTTGHYQMEDLDRGVVAVKVTGGVYVGWRMMGYEYNKATPTNISYNLYRDGTKLANVTNSTNYLDTAGTTTSKYTVAAVIGGTECAQSDSPTVWAQNYLDIPLTPPATGPNGGTYSANDASTGDLDGDGKLDIVLKWDPSNSQDNSNSGVTVTHLRASACSASILAPIFEPARTTRNFQCMTSTATARPKLPAKQRPERKTARVPI